MNDQSTYEIIERYLAGTLSEVELAAFERRLETEPELQDELQVHRDLQDAVGDTEVMAFLQSVENAENEYLAGNLETGGDQDAAPEPRVIRPFWRQSYSIAAAVILLAVVGFFVFRGMGGGSSRQLYQDYFAVYDGAEWRGAGLDQEEKLNAALDAYNRADYATAQREFSELSARDPENAALSFYHAMSAMANKDIGSAKPILQTLTDRSGHSYQSQSRWYLALVHLKEGNEEAARPLLEELAGKPGKFGKLAKELLEEM